MLTILSKLRAETSVRSEVIGRRAFEVIGRRAFEVIGRRAFEVLFKK